MNITYTQSMSIYLYTRNLINKLMHNRANYVYVVVWTTTLISSANYSRLKPAFKGI
jgi:hypothetical protein